MEIKKGYNHFVKINRGHIPRIPFYMKISTNIITKIAQIKVTHIHNFDTFLAKSALYAPKYFPTKKLVALDIPTGIINV